MLPKFIYQYILLSCSWISQIFSVSQENIYPLVTEYTQGENGLGGEEKRSSQRTFEIFSILKLT